MFPIQRHLHVGRRKLIPVVISRQLTTKTSPQQSTAQPLPLQNDEVQEVKPFSEMPGPKGIFKLPYIGFLFHLKPFSKYTTGMVHHVLDDLADRYGPVYKVNLEEPSVVISGREDIAKMYRVEGKCPNRPAIDLLVRYYQRTGKKRDLTVLQGEEWMKLRGPINRRVLRPGVMSQYLNVQNEVADDFVKMLARGSSTDYKDNDGPFFWFAAESVGVILFNARIQFLVDEQSELSKEFIKATETFFRLVKMSVTGETVLYKFYEDKIYKEFEHALNVIDRETKKYTQQAHKELERKKRDGTFDPQEPNFLLSLLNDKDLTEDDVVNIMNAMYTAGVDSTGSTLQSTFYLLATNPDKQAILREEVHQMMGRDGPLTKEALDNMPYLRACLKESYRCQYPITSGTVRVFPFDVVFGEYNVPAGVKVFNFNRRILREGFENPDDFIPERWLRSEGEKTPNESQHSAWALLPFSFGARGCIGKRVAEQELYLGVAKAVQKLEIGLEPDSWDTEFDYNIFSKPRTPLKFTFKEI